VVINGEDNIQYPGIRERLGELCYSSGLLRALQRMRAWVRQDLRILAYHRVLTLRDPNAFEFDLDLVSASADGFREQMQLLQRHFSPMALGDVVAALDAGTRLPANAVVVTFDDGYDDNHRVAYPILRELGVPATFFVSTHHIDSGRPFAYDWLVHMILRAPVPRLALPELELDLPMPPRRAGRRQLASQVLRRMKGFDDATQSSMIARLEHEWQMPRDAGHPDCRPMSWDALREMRSSGFEVGSHGVGHCMLAQLPPEQLEAELVESRAALERELGEPVTVLSYPVGGDLAFDRRVMEATMAAGYRAACSYICGTNPQSALNRFALHRLPVERAMGTGWFAAMLALPELMGYPTVSRLGKPAQDPACSY
jgi:peptidoglycan/xylan/chitin deacetylase (PgdA/CDA1 family)